jgi:hypothetical protein
LIAFGLHSPRSSAHGEPVLAAAYPIARKILFSLDAETAHHAREL